MKTKCNDGGSYFYNNKKYRLLEIEKKNVFLVISFQKFLIFYVCAFSENAQFSSECSFKLADHDNFQNIRELLEAATRGVL